MIPCPRCKGRGVEWFMLGSKGAEPEPEKDVCSRCDGVGEIDDEPLNMEDDDSDDDPPEDMSNLVLA